MNGDMQVSFEYAMRDSGLDFTVDSFENTYVKGKTRLAFKAFCEGYNCCNRGG